MPSATTSDAETAPVEHPKVAPRRWAKSLSIVEAVLAVGVGCLVVVVHDVPYLLRTPFWLDEAWVAVSTRVPVSKLPTATASTPIGWTALLRVIPSPGQQDLRLLPLLFAALTVVAAYALGWTLRLLPVVTGLLAAEAALLVPALLVRNDLKQYTADAFVVVLGLALVSALEAQWSRPRLGVLVAVIVLAGLISHIALFLGAAGLPALAVTRLAKRRRRELLDAVVATGITGICLLAILLGLDSGTNTPALRTYWRAYYIPHHLGAAIHYIHVRFEQLLPLTGMRHQSLFVIFVLLGLGVLVWRGRWATAAILPLMGLTTLVLSAIQRYPLLDERTSTFLVAACVVVAAIGVAGAATVVAQRTHLVAGLAIAAAAAALYVPGTLSYVGDHTIPYENVRAQEQYVHAHAAPDDVVIVSEAATYGYAYYNPTPPEVSKTAGIGFSISYPAADRLFMVTDRTAVAIDTAFSQATAELVGHPGARLWIIMNHLNAVEVSTFNAEMARLPITIVSVAPGTHVYVAAMDARPAPTSPAP